AVVAVQMLKRPQKGLLRGIFRRLGFAQHAIAQVIDVRLVGFDQFCESFVTALLGLGHPGHFFVHAFSLNFLLRLRDKMEKVAQLSSRTLPQRYQNKYSLTKATLLQVYLGTRKNADLSFFPRESALACTGS